MVSQGIVHKVELSDLDEYLFVSNKSNSKSKLVRREISLDWGEVYGSDIENGIYV